MKKKFKNIKYAALFIHNKLKKNSNILLSGGKTIESLLNHLLNLKKKLHFKTLLLSDERIVDTKSKLRNDKMIKRFIKLKTINTKKLINYKSSNINKKNLTKISNLISKVKFDYCLLSLGSNCHVASIFNFKSNENANFYSIENSPKKPRKRVTVSKKIISNCKKIFLIANYNEKKKEISNVFKNSFFKKLRNKLVLLIYKN